MRTRACCLIVALAVALSISACSTPAPKRTASAGQSDAVTTIRVGYIQGNYPISEDPIIEGFQASHPGYRVEKVPIETDYGNVLAAFLRNQQVDAIFMNHSGGEHGQAGLLAELTPYVQKSSFDLSRMALGASDLMYLGKLYSLPYQATPRVLYANTELFKAAGVELPKDGWTWEQFRETTARLTKPAEGIYGLSGSALEFLTQVRLLEAAEGQSAWRASPDAFKSTLEYFSTLALTDRSASKLPRFKPEEGPLQKARDVSDFINGKAAMAIGPLTADFEGFPAAVLPMPTLSGKQPVLLTWYFSVAIPANAPHPDLGWEFVRYAAGPEGAVQLAKSKILPMYMTKDVEEAWVTSRAPGGEFVVKSRLAGHTGGGTTNDMRLSQLMFDTINLALSGTSPWDLASEGFLSKAEMYKTP